MGYYYDWVDRKWVPRQDATPTPAQRRLTARRRDLIRNLLTEIEHHGDSVVYLYTALLTRTLVQRDEELMREFGKQVVGATSERVMS
jgi:hypothetical protein